MMKRIDVPTSTYSSVANLKDLRKQREAKQAQAEKYGNAQTIVDRVEAKIASVEKLAATKHNKSLDTNQVVLDQYRDGLKFAASMAGNILVNVLTGTLAGIEVPKGQDAVLHRGADGKVDSFESHEVGKGNRYVMESNYSKQVQADGTTLYKVSEFETLKGNSGKPLGKSTTIKMEQNGTLFVQES